MPTMPRPKNKATKILFKILGVPANMQAKKDKKQKIVNKRLIYEETSRVR